MHRVVGMAVVVAFFAILALSSSVALAKTVSGMVVGSDGKPLPGVRVRLGQFDKGTQPVSGTAVATTGPDGKFAMESTAVPGQYQQVSFGKKGYLNQVAYYDPAGPLLVGTVELKPLPMIDNDHYQWWKPMWPKDDTTDQGCNFCHGEQGDAWVKSIMAGSAKNERVLSLYKGTDLKGAPVGGGYRDLHPDKAGPCANCHAAAAAVDAPFDTRLDLVEGVAANGVFCEVCHKTRDVEIGAGAGVGGALKMQRPAAWVNLFGFGPFEDIGPMPMTTSYSPLITQSRFCGGCHEWTNDHGVPVLSTYSEWAEMSGADPDALQCQDCHMKKKFGKDWQGEDTSKMAFILNDAHIQQMHGTLRPVSKIFPHVFVGADKLAAEAAAVTLEAAQVEGALRIKVAVKNVNAGHALPTGMPFRHMILHVQASIGDQPLTQTDGPKVPEYGGVGDAAEDLAGVPGKGYARVLGDGKGGRNVPFWDATEVIEDTRVRPAGQDEVTLRFAVPEAGGKASVKASLIYRRALRDMNLKRSWALKDEVIGQGAAEVTLTPWVKTVTPTDDKSAGDAASAADGDAGGCNTGARAGGAMTSGLVLLLATLLLLLRRREESAA